MPESVCQIVQYFHDYSKKHAVQMQTMMVVADAQIASHFMCEEGGGTQCTTVEELKDHPVFADLNLYEDQIDSVLEKEDIVNGALEAMSA